MKLKLTIDQFPKHEDVATGVAWSSVDTIFSIGDDHKLVMWNLTKNETSTVTQFPPDLFPTSMEWPPRSQSGVAGVSRKGTELLLVTAADGHFHLLGRGARIEKSVQGHQGAILCGHWNLDGSELITSGEDGSLRVWSRAGMLRSTLAQCPEPIYACSWSPDNQSVLYSVGCNLIKKPFAPQGKIVQWKAHDAVILCLAWNSISKLIVSGGEDCTYRVWDDHGRSIFTSSVHPHPITSVAWTPSGDLFSVGSFNTLRLCDRFGWSHCLEKLKTGSVYSMSWSTDGTQFGCATASGHVFLASVIEKNVSWGTHAATLRSRRSILVTEFTANTEDRLDFRDRVIKMSMEYGYLICVTTSQVYIYNVKNVNTPIVTDLRDNTAISLVLQSNTNFALCGGIFVAIWTYDGKQISSVKWPGMRSELMNVENASLASDIIVFIDQTDSKLIRIFDVASGKPFTEIKWLSSVRQIALSRDDYAGAVDRQLALIDANQDLLYVLLKKFGAAVSPRRLTTAVTSMVWHNEAPMLAAIKEGKLRLYYFPQVIFIDGALLDHTFEDKDGLDLGKQPQILKYETSTVHIRRSDGVVILGTASPFIARLHAHGVQGKFNEARRLCRYISSKPAWGVLAGLSAWKQELMLAEMSYAALGMYEKVVFIKDIKNTKTDEVTRKTMLYILSGNFTDAEKTLLQNDKIADAVELNASSCRFERALELAIKGNVHVDVVLEARKKYLEAIDKKEKIQAFIDAEKQYRAYSSAATTKKKPNKGGGKKKKQSLASAELDEKMKGDGGSEGLGGNSDVFSALNSTDKHNFDEAVVEGGSGDTGFGMKPKRIPRSDTFNKDEHTDDVDRELANTELDTDQYF